MKYHYKSILIPLKQDGISKQMIDEMEVEKVNEYGNDGYKIRAIHTNDEFKNILMEKKSLF